MFKLSKWDYLLGPSQQTHLRGSGHWASLENPKQCGKGGFSLELGVWEWEGYAVPFQQDWTEPIYVPYIYASPVFSELISCIKWG